MSSKTPTPPSATTIRRTTSGTIILEKYQLDRFLGHGSFAKVYRARSLPDNSLVAIKVIEKTSWDPTMESRLVREVSAMRRLNSHPNILNLHEVMATKTKIYLVMELAKGGDIFTKLARRGRLTESTARKYFQQLVSALYFCHQNGVAHRDLKPQNLLLDEFGNLKVSDFGLTALPEQLKNGLLHTACGTPGYTAPEVLRQKGYDGPKADAWSCGVILFGFLAGYLPFDDCNMPKMYKKMYRREFVFPDWVSKPSRNIIYRLLDPNPNTRMGMESLMDLKWFKKSLQCEPQAQSEPNALEGLLGKECSKYGSSLNAFDIISMSSGLNLSGLFDGDLQEKERWFSARGPVRDVEERVVKVGGELGYKVEKGNGREIGLVRGKVVLLVRILEVVAKIELLMVELNVVRGGDGFEWFEWQIFKLGVGDIVVSLHNKER